MTRKLGWKRGPLIQRDPDALRLRALRLVDKPPARASLRQFAPPRLEQAFDDCTVTAAATAVHVSQRIQQPTRPPPPILSRTFTYWTARNYHGEADRDDGTYLRAVYRSLNRFGFCPDDVWPYDTAHLLERPSLEAFRRASDQQGTIGPLENGAVKPAVNYALIETDGPTRVFDAKRAIASGYPVEFGTKVVRRFHESGPTLEIFDVPQEGEEIAGGHAMTILEYDERGFYGPQSWDEDFGFGGWFAISPAYLAWVYTQDLYAVRAAPFYSEE